MEYATIYVHFWSKKNNQWDRLQKIQIKLIPVNISEYQVTDSATFGTDTKIQCKCSNCNKTIICFIQDKVTNKLPSLTIPFSKRKIPYNNNLADLEFTILSRVDLILEEEAFSEVRNNENSPYPYSHSTQLKWLIGEQ